MSLYSDDHVFVLFLTPCLEQSKKKNKGSVSIGRRTPEFRQWVRKAQGFKKISDPYRTFYNELKYISSFSQSPIVSQLWCQNCLERNQMGIQEMNF